MKYIKLELCTTAVYLQFPEKILESFCYTIRSVISLGVIVNDEPEASHIISFQTEGPSVSDEQICSFPIKAHLDKGALCIQVESFCADTSFLYFVFSNALFLYFYLFKMGDIFPIHCASIIKDNRATILVGHSGVGKSTCYRSLKGGWYGGSDDLSFVLFDGDTYHLFPFPTWSNFGDCAKDSQQTWDLSKRFILDSIFQLAHGDDTVETVNPIDAVMELLNQITIFFKIFDIPVVNPSLYKKRNLQMYHHAERLSKAFPLKKMKHRLDGHFLTLIEEHRETV